MRAQRDRTSSKTIVILTQRTYIGLHALLSGRTFPIKIVILSEPSESKDLRLPFLCFTDNEAHGRVRSHFGDHGEFCL